MVLNQDFREFLQSLNNNGVHYLVIGGYAVAFHGHPRYTKDLDVWIEVSEENAVRLVLAMGEFGFGSLGLQAEDFTKPGQVVQLGYPPNRIDILTSIRGVEFANAYSKRIQVLVDEGVEASFIDRESLTQNKRATGRAQDLADVENLAP